MSGRYRAGSDETLRNEAGECIAAVSVYTSTEASDRIAFIQRIALSLNRGAAFQEMREALDECRMALELASIARFEDSQFGDEIRALGDRIGFGALMASASASWARRLREHGDSDGGAFVAGPCVGTVNAALAKAWSALALADSVGEEWERESQSSTKRRKLLGGFDDQGGVRFIHITDDGPGVPADDRFWCEYIDARGVQQACMAASLVELMTKVERQLNDTEAPTSASEP